MNVTIYSKSQCPNCVAAKLLLKSKGLAYDEISLDDDDQRDQFCAQYPGVQQMPQIFINGQRVGGLAGLQAALKQLDLILPGA